MKPPWEIPTCEVCHQPMIQALQRPICGKCLHKELESFRHWLRHVEQQGRVERVVQTTHEAPAESS